MTLWFLSEAEITYSPVLICRWKWKYQTANHTFTVTIKVQERINKWEKIVPIRVTPMKNALIFIKNFNTTRLWSPQKDLGWQRQSTVSAIERSSYEASGLCNSEHLVVINNGIENEINWQFLAHRFVITASYFPCIPFQIHIAIYGHFQGNSDRKRKTNK